MRTTYPAGGTFRARLYTYDLDTKENKDADSTPTIAAYVNGSADSGFTFTVTDVGTGIYTVSGTIPSTYMTGDVVDIEATATVTSTTTTAKTATVALAQFVIRQNNFDTLATQASVNELAASAGSGTPYSLTSLTRNIGSDQGGTLASTYAQDGAVYSTGEVVGSGMKVTGDLSASDITLDPEFLEMYAGYDASGGAHLINVYLNNYNSSSLVLVGYMLPITGMQRYLFPVPQPATDYHHPSTGAMQVVWEHNVVSPYVAAHRHNLDFVRFLKADPNTVDVTHWAGQPVSTDANGLPNVNVADWKGTAVATPDTAGYPKVTHKTGTGAGEMQLDSGNVTLKAGTHTDAVIPTVTTVTNPVTVSGGTIDTVTNNVTVAGITEDSTKLIEQVRQRVEKIMKKMSIREWR